MNMFSFLSSVRSSALLGTALAALVYSIRVRDLRTSTIAVGLVPMIAFGYAAVALVPIANEIASTRPLVRA
ncbi:hypothetical protein, partial [Deinococcus sp.]|uniref:hypothetical protein n=1 Tax=Deinococcus sp. TaxID=47478 RepID=UPI00286DCE20